MKIIGISGHAENGKDTVCANIEAVLGRHGSRVVRIGFADALKSDCRKMGWDGVKDEKGRAMLQKEGVLRRTEDPNYWIGRAFDSMRADPFVATTVFVIPDVRFRNEADAIRAEGGEVWRVNRYRWVGLERAPWENSLTPEQRAHSSEIDLDDYPFDAVIENPDEMPNVLAFRVGYTLSIRGFVPISDR